MYSDRVVMELRFVTWGLLVLAASSRTVDKGQPSINLYRDGSISSSNKVVKASNSIQYKLVV